MAANNPRSRKKTILAVAVLLSCLAGACWLYSNRDGPINRSLYDQLHLGLSEKEAEAIIPVEEGWKEQEILLVKTPLAKEGGVVYKNDDVDVKQFKNAQAHFFDRKTGQFISKFRTWEDHKHSITLMFDADGKMIGRELQLISPQFTWFERTSESIQTWFRTRFR